MDPEVFWLAAFSLAERAAIGDPHAPAAYDLLLSAVTPPDTPTPGEAPNGDD